jgi:hypothetical protein
LRDYLIEKITNDAARRHIDAGMDAIEIFEKILSDRLTLPSGKKRRIAVIPTGDMIDTYGRLLAYVAPWYANTQTDPLPNAPSIALYFTKACLSSSVSSKSKNNLHFYLSFYF